MGVSENDKQEEEEEEGENVESITYSFAVGKKAKLWKRLNRGRVFSLAQPGIDRERLLSELNSIGQASGL